MIKCAIGIICLIQFALVNYSQQQYNNQQVSPCPQVFEYRNEGNQWYGVITANSDRLQSSEITLQLTLSLRASTTQNNAGEIALLDSPEVTTNNINSHRPIRYRVEFPFQYPLPKVVQIIHDNNLICSGSAEDPSAGGIVSQIDLHHMMTTPTGYSGDLLQLQPAPPNYQPQQPTYHHQQQALPVYQQNNYQHQPQPQQPQQPFDPYAPPPQPKPTATISPPTKSTANRFQVTTNQDINSVCGQRQSDSAVSGFIFGGEETRRGDWPWLAAIYVSRPTGLAFTCGGSLVSSRAVLTAAHCINTAEKSLQPDDIIVWLGRYKLTDWTEPGAISSHVEEVHVHSDYMRKRNSFDADLAVLVLQQQVEFSQYIRPICLWPSVQSTNDIEGQEGTVVGWGQQNSERIVSNVPKKIDLPIVNALTCLQKSEALSQTISERTYCAGTLDGSGPCHGDSGGSMTLLRQSRWTLRGIVSSGLSDINTNSCKLTDYVVFTDTSKFVDWIRAYM